MEDPREDAVEAAVWAVTAELVQRLGSRAEVAELHLLDGAYNVIRVAIAESGGRVLLNRPGRIHIDDASGSEQYVSGDDIWDRLADGSDGIGSTVEGLMRRLGLGASRSHDLHVFGIIAELMRLSALFNLGWRCLWGVLDTPSGVAARSPFFFTYRDDLYVRWDGDDVVPDDLARRIWFVVGSRDEPVGCFTTDGYVYASDGGRAELAVSYPSASPANVAADLFGARIHRDASRAARHTPGLSVEAALSAFNRKERFFLWQSAGSDATEYELSGVGVRLSETFRTQLEATTGLAVPSHAWAGVDFHLSWLHAALQWVAGSAWPGQLPPHLGTSSPDGAALVDGSQEDVDLVIAWTARGVPHLILVEAKGYGAWSNSQALSKIPRLDAILQAAPAVEARIVLTSPRPSTHLHTTNWPDFALRDGKPLWMPLPVPGARLATQRVDPSGHPAASGVNWRMTGPTK